MQVEIPYIPASQRHPAHTIEDSIVVVGQARQKKRKRTKVAPDGPAALPSAESSNVGGTPQQQQNAGSNDDPPTEESVPFDFSAVPNILDDNPNSEETKKKRQRKQKHGMCIPYDPFDICSRSFLSLIFQVASSMGISLPRRKLTVSSSAEINRTLLNSRDTWSVRDFQTLYLFICLQSG